MCFTFVCDCDVEKIYVLKHVHYNGSAGLLHRLNKYRKIGSSLLSVTIILCGTTCTQTDDTDHRSSVSFK